MLLVIAIAIVVNQVFRAFGDTSVEGLDSKNMGGKVLGMLVGLQCNNSMNKSTEVLQS